ncbi:LOW QUALITY PROTEIN: tudor and KH domain-containing protein-like [Lethenteron reissneri]|uniref:LOW QUALITY PROTEIN: tudor and KH domain-containing protein-like n=1 Tax=Lethenteron reissneri TaxID=7753 RepID=UPI002AB7B4FD|nr:LOW QUALITY PROTEIN: tudor and KH domain-containing protein-like [Lethenteron reissneri]
MEIGLSNGRDTVHVNAFEIASMGRALADTMPWQRWGDLGTGRKVALLLAVPSGAALLYFLYHRLREYGDEDLAQNGSGVARRILTTVEMSVPVSALGAIIGKQGATINQLQRETGAQVFVQRAPRGERDARGQEVVRIRGTPDDVCRASVALHRIVAESATAVEELRLPQRAVGRIMGRGGQNIRAIQRHSNAKINCEHAGGLHPDSERVFTIVGTHQQIEMAKSLLLEKVAEEEDFRSEVLSSVAARHKRKVSGTCHSVRGPNLNVTAATTAVAVATTATVACTFTTAAATFTTATTTVACTPATTATFTTAVAAATTVAACNFTTAITTSSTANAATAFTFTTWPGQRPPPSRSEGSEPCPEETTEPVSSHESSRESSHESSRESSHESSHESSQEVRRATFEVPSPVAATAAGEFFEVYVSALEHPGHAWLQILGPRSLQLDRLTAEMSIYYGSEDSAAEAVPAPGIGDVVSAPFDHASVWYRARVARPASADTVELYYVDYGDSAVVPAGNLRPLRSDFLSLPFQAVECSLAQVKPVGACWSEEASDAFERLTHCACWTALQAKIVRYVATDSGGVVPSVQLVDATGEQSVDVAAELVRLGHAAWEEPEPEEGTGGTGGTGGGQSPGPAAAKIQNGTALTVSAPEVGGDAEPSDEQLEEQLDEQLDESAGDSGVSPGIREPRAETTTGEEGSLQGTLST